MLTITLQGDEASQYLDYVNSLRQPYDSTESTEPKEKKARTSLNSKWRSKIDTNKVPDATVTNKAWTNAERLTVDNAINRPDSKYYNIDVLAKYLGRSRGAIVAEANRQGSSIRNNMLIKDED